MPLTEFSWVIVPPVQNPSVWKSMSNACGLTAEPPLLGTAEMSTLIPPVPGYKHPVPLEFAFGNRLIDPRQVLIDDPARAEVEVANFGVTHLSFG